MWSSIARNSRAVLIYKGQSPCLRIGPPAQAPLQTGNFVGAVVELCQSHFHPTPTYTFWAQAEDGPIPSGPWVARVQTVIGGQELLEEYASSSKASAKQVAAQHLLPKLRAALEAEAGIPIEEALSGMDNYKGKLQEVLSKVHQALPPQYVIRRSGVDNCPVFVAEVTAGLQDFPFTVAGDPELTRLAAEQSAARKMLGHIEIDQ